jgi:hypothetical protein
MPPHPRADGPHHSSAETSLPRKPSVPESVSSGGFEPTTSDVSRDPAPYLTSRPTTVMWPACPRQLQPHACSRCRWCLPPPACAPASRCLVPAPPATTPLRLAHDPHAIPGSAASEPAQHVRRKFSHGEKERRQQPGFAIGAIRRGRGEGTQKSRGDTDRVKPCSTSASHCYRSKNHCRTTSNCPAIRRPLQHGTAHRSRTG